MGKIAELGRQCKAVLGLIEVAGADASLEAMGESRVARLRRMLGEPADLRVRALTGGGHVLYFATIVNEPHLEASVLEPLARAALAASEEAPLLRRLDRVGTYAEALDAILAGDAVVLLPRPRGAFRAHVAKWPRRSPTEPPAEVITRGPHLGFVESLDDNVALIRQGVPDPHLRYERSRVATRSGTEGALLYIDGMVAAAVLARVRSALDRTRASVVTDASMLLQHLSPTAHLFPTIGTTERPDVACAALLEGRVVILTDGSPTALLAPQVFAHLLAVPEDYYQRGFVALFDRSFRLAGLLLTLATAALYVALATVNLELIPTPLFLSIAQSRLGVPMPLVFEVLALEAVIELIRQAGLRLPSSFGQSISIVGAVVIGQSAVMAGLLSAPAVVVVSLEFIASFIVPSQTAAMTARILRLPLILLSATFGLFGLALGLLLLLVYLSSLESFGVPYLAPLLPLRRRGLQDTLVRRPLRRLRASFVAGPADAEGT